MSAETRYWPRVGMYVTKEFAEQWVEKMSNGSSVSGKYLDDDVEEYVAPVIIRTSTLMEEIEELFNAPFEAIDLDDDMKGILMVAEMERNKINRIKELKAEGYELSEAKEMVQSEINQAVAGVMGIDLEEYQAREDARIAEARKGVDDSEDSLDDGEE